MRRALLLTLVTIAWNLIEGGIAIAAATAAGSVALLGFGVDSFVESASGSVMLWRLLREMRGATPEAIAHLDRRAQKLIAASLFLLAAYVAWDATNSLWMLERPSPTLVGVILTIVSLVVMVWLARAKRRVAVELGSRAMQADAFQTTACWWLSLVALAGIGLNAALGWWWADPVAALAMTFFLAREGRSVWRGDECCP